MYTAPTMTTAMITRIMIPRPKPRNSTARRARRPVLLLGVAVKPAWLGASLGVPGPVLPVEPADTVAPAHRVVTAGAGDRAVSRALRFLLENKLDIPLRDPEIARGSRGHQRIVRGARVHAPEIVI